MPARPGARKNASTRGEFAKMLVRWRRHRHGAVREARERAIGDETPEDKIPYIRAAIANGLMNGYGTENGVTLFGANDSLDEGSPAFEVLRARFLTTTVSRLSSRTSRTYPTGRTTASRSASAAGAVNGYEDNTIRSTKSYTIQSRNGDTALEAPSTGQKNGGSESCRFPGFRMRHVSLRISDGVFPVTDLKVLVKQCEVLVPAGARYLLEPARRSVSAVSQPLSARGRYLCT